MVGWYRGGGPAGIAPGLSAEGTKNSRASSNRFMESEDRRLLLFPCLFGCLRPEVFLADVRTDLNIAMLCGFQTGTREIYAFTQALLEARSK